MSPQLTFSQWERLDAMPILNEDASPRQVITHLTHIEDLVVTKQYPGAVEAETFIKELVAYFSGTADTALNLTVKIDGSPSIVVGNDPADGKFFVGTKGALTKNPKVAKSLKEIDELYAGKEGLITTMREAFTYLSPLSWTGVLQGDVLFTKLTKKLQTLSGVTHVVFKPNTILYAVPHLSTLGKQIERAKFGISFHTTYVGESLPELVAKPGADVSRLDTSPDVVFVSNEYRDLSGSVTFTRADMMKLTYLLRDVTIRTLRIRHNVFVQLLKALPLLQSEFMMFQNALVRQGNSITLSPSTFSKQFVLFLAGRQRKISAEKKTYKGMEAVSERYKTIAKAVADSYTDVVAMLGWQHAVIEVKEFLLDKLNAPSKLATFYETDRGVVAGPHEGFVASDSKGNFVKLVSRGTFSKINLNTSRFNRR